jgi:hypothetical protein
MRALARSTTPLLALVGLLTVGVIVPAHADPSDEVAALASDAQARADRLQRRLDVAVERYAAALRGLASAVNDSVGDDRVAQESTALADAASVGQEQRVRAIYMSGGSIGLVGSVLAAQTPRDLASRMANVSAVVDFGSVVVGDASALAADAREQALVSRAAARRRIGTVQDVEAAYTHLTTVLAAERARAERLSNEAERLAARERLAAARAAAAAAAASAPSNVTAGGIPVDFLRLYRAAADTCSGLPWVVLAAVGQVESGHGRNNGPSSSGAEGPMQFLPSTFAAYAVDGDRDGDTDIWDPADAIFTGAHYLCANGGGRGPAGLYNALWHYNHADWYVQLVVNVAGQLAARFGEPVPVATA